MDTTDEARSRSDALDRVLDTGNAERAIGLFESGTIFSDDQADRWFDIVTSRPMRHVMEIQVEGESIWFTVNNKAKDRILSLLTSGGLISVQGNADSGGHSSYVFDEIAEVTLRRVTPRRNIRRNTNGGWFNKINTSIVDISDIQIFNQYQMDSIFERSKSKDEEVLKDLYNKELEQCLISTFKYYKIDDKLISTIKLLHVTGSHIRKSDLESIANILKRNIIIKYYSGRFIKSSTHKANEILHKPLYIGLHNNHYFQIYDTKYTKYAVKNYDILSDREEWWMYTSKKAGKNGYAKCKKINTLDLVYYLDTVGVFKEGVLLAIPNASKDKALQEFINLDNIITEQRGVVVKDKPTVTTRKEKQKGLFNLDFETNEIWYADCEAEVASGQHDLLNIGFVNNVYEDVMILDSDEWCYRSSDHKTPITEFLDIVTNYNKNNALVYFHNLKYDYNLIEAMIPKIVSRCEENGMIYSVTIKVKDKVVELRDSFKILGFGLAKFATELQLDTVVNNGETIQLGKMEAMAYPFYTHDNYNEEANIVQYSINLSKDDQIIFLSRMLGRECNREDLRRSYIERQNIIRDLRVELKSKGIITFAAWDYLREYLKLDVLTLKYGMKTFDYLCQENMEQSVFKSLTISSIADKYFKQGGSFKGIYEVKDMLRSFIAKAVAGGRVIVNPKYRGKLIEDRILDYDACSLYPSAIFRMCTQTERGKSVPMGLPTGPAKLLTYLDKWNDYVYSILEIKITKVNKKQQLPIIAFKDENGTTQFSNDPPPQNIVIDCITLEDYIWMHQIEFEVIQGIYYDNKAKPDSEPVYNYTMGSLVQKLYNDRMGYKASKQVALANLLKLVLNSAYGKTIKKAGTTKTDIIRTEKSVQVEDLETGELKWCKKMGYPYENYINQNYHFITNTRKINDITWEFKKMITDTSYNRGHIGCAVLSYSKRIMNEVFDIANTLQKPIYYCDTDSMLIRENDITQVEVEYKRIYNRDLRGEQLLQFHPDFKLGGSVKQIAAIKTVVVGKKTYYCLIESVDKTGKKLIGHHIRAKGITKEGLADKVNKNRIVDDERPETRFHNSYLELYQSLGKGIKEEFILNPTDKRENKRKVLFDLTKGVVTTKRKFARNVHYPELYVEEIEEDVIEEVEWDSEEFKFDELLAFEKCD